MKPIIAIFVAASVLTGGWARADQPPASLSLQGCIEQAIRHNFDVQLARYAPEQSRDSLAAVYGAYDPLFNFTGQHSYDKTPGSLTDNQLEYPSSVANSDNFQSGFTGLLPEGLTYDISGGVTKNRGYYTDPDSSFQTANGNIGITLDQPLLKNFWVDQTRLEVKAAKTSLKYAEQGLRAQLITSVSAIETAYYELIYAQENLEVQQEALRLAQTQLTQDQQRMQIGTLAELSVEQDQSQVAQSKANLITAQFTLASDQNTLKGLITDDYAHWHYVDIQPTERLEAAQQTFDLQESWNSGMRLRPDLLQAQLTLEQQGIQLKFDRNQVYPQLDLTGSYGYNGAGVVYDDVFGQIRDQSSPFFSYGAKLTLPLANTQARNTLKADKVTEREDLLKLKELEQSILVAIDNAVKEAQSDYESVQATRQARMYAETALDAEQKTYGVGKATTFEVLTYQNNLTTARGQEIRALANYEEALANLAQQEGSTLERRKIDVTVN